MRPVARLVCVLALVASGCGRHESQMPQRVDFRLDGGGTVATGSLLVADTPSERERGLMDVTSLGADEGMVFLYDEPTVTRFWMKDTEIPLSIAFWRRDGRVVDILNMAPCVADPCPTYAARAPYTTALEMRLGWFRRHGIQIGDHADLSYKSL
jgi:hypothetical protein